MALKVVTLSLVRLIHTHGLLIERLDVRRQQPFQSKLLPFRFGEGCSFV